MFKKVATNPCVKTTYVMNNLQSRHLTSACGLRIKQVKFITFSKARPSNTRSPCEVFHSLSAILLVVEKKEMMENIKGQERSTQKSPKHT